MIDLTAPPEQIADSLIEQFKPHADWYNEYGSSEEKANMKHAKACAILCVENMLRVCPQFIPNTNGMGTSAGYLKLTQTLEVLKGE